MQKVYTHEGKNVFRRIVLHQPLQLDSPEDD